MLSSGSGCSKATRRALFLNGVIAMLSQVWLIGEPSWYPQLCATVRLQEAARQPISAVLENLLLTTACTELTRCES